MTTKDTDQKTCLCGCGEVVKTSRALYRPGHDSRHVALVARRVVLQDTQGPLEELPSEALRERARRAAQVLAGSALGELSGGWTAR